MVFRKYLKKIQVEQNLVEVLRHYKTEERSKKGQKLQNSYGGISSCAPSHRPCALAYETVFLATSCAHAPHSKHHAHVFCTRGANYLFFKLF